MARLAAGQVVATRHSGWQQRRSLVAALAQSPERFQAVLCQCADLDMVGYYRFENYNPPAPSRDEGREPVALLYDTKAGHAGSRPLGKIIEDVSLEPAFLFWQLGMDE